MRRLDLRLDIVTAFLLYGLLDAVLLPLPPSLATDR